ncbi:CDP-glycerol glycerophosphotransferase family protein [Streptomyces sp. NBC_01012]|uniref:CDP-glycerol glycerophosphotransferase family protein n=1 Tax=Streptomyces sp. NBC_01012 TaxID=2903717 RepID=UPI003870970A|nr:CDP-glycerol glycerophosphotransferase family protein [Streptomyces sp. NBC_01012]
MESDERILVPVGPDAARWRTFGTERTVVAAARTVTSLLRVLDVLPEIVHDDPRITVVFAYDPTSAFNNGVLDLLRSQGCRILPWSQLGEITPDLLISASENIKVPHGDYPVLVLPHGVGFHKQVPDSSGPGTRLSGLVHDDLLAARRAWLAISHPDQEAQLAAAHPGTVGRTVLVGDPCLDRLRASVRWRERYRAALGVAAGTRLVLVSSTWGEESLAGSWPGLPADLLAQLPTDEYRVALVLHPNVWSAHGDWQVRLMQRTALESGLIVVDPTDGWQQALVASDLVIGDHGSVTLYGAALDRPLLLGAFGSEAVHGTAGYALRSAAVRLEPDHPLRQQLDAASAGHRRDGFAEVSAAAFAEPGRALSKLRELVYDLLHLPRPKQPGRGPRAFPVRALSATTARSLMVHTSVVRVPGDEPRVEVRRFPAALAGETAESESAFWHLACDVEEPDTRLTESAAVIWSASEVLTPDAGRQRVSSLLADFPGARIAAVPAGDGRCVVGVRDGASVHVGTAEGPGPDPGTAAAAVYVCLRLGMPLEAAAMTVVQGRRGRRLVLGPVPPAAGQSAVSRARTSAARGLPPFS